MSRPKHLHTASDPWSRAARKNPLYFGVPFVLIMVAGSFVLSTFTQTRYDLHEQKVAQMTKEEEIGLKRNRRIVNIREEYFRLESKKANDNWEPVRVPRPAGTGEWGVPPPSAQ